MNRPPDHRSVNRKVWMFFVVLMAASFLHFWVRTAPVRFANPDDLAFQRVVNAGSAESYMVSNAISQGRFYFATPLYHYLLLSPYSLEAPWAFGVFRAGLFFLQAGLLGCLAGRLLRNGFLGAAVTLLVVSSLHLPSTFFPVLSYPAMGLGFSALLGALHCHLSYVRSHRHWLGACAAILFLFSCLSLELFVVLLPLFLAISLDTGGRSHGSMLRENMGVLIAAAAYFVVYFGFAWKFPSTYSGTHLSFDPVAGLGVLLRQVVGVVPGFELAVNRLPAGSNGDLFRPMAEIAMALGHTPPMDFVLGTAQAVAIVWLVVLGTQSRVVPARYWVSLVGFAFVVNLPIAVSAKYQNFIFHRQYPYIYGFYSFCLLSWALVALVAWCAGRSGRIRQWSLAIFGIAVLSFCLTAKSSNHHVLAELAGTYCQP
jgi:hypothetical protein